MPQVEKLRIEYRLIKDSIEDLSSESSYKRLIQKAKEAASKIPLDSSFIKAVTDSQRQLNEFVLHPRLTSFNHS